METRTKLHAQVFRICVVGLVIIICFAFSKAVSAACSGSSPNWTAASASLPDISDCVTAASNGDKINISGNATWSSTLSISKGIWLHSTGGTITSTVANPLTFNLTEAACSSTPVEVDGFTFDDKYNTTSSDTAVLTLSGTCKKYKIHDNVWNHSGLGDNNAIHTTGESYGVIYKNTFGGPGFAVSVNHGTWGGGTFGDGSWSDYPYLGTEKFWYFEGNTFVGSVRTGASDASAGSRIVYRYNTLSNGTLSGHGFDSDNNGRGRGMRLSITYKNSLTGPSDYSTCIQVRAGTGFIYENEMTGWQSGGYCVHGRTYRWPTSYTNSGKCNDTTVDKMCSGIVPASCIDDGDCIGNGTCVGPLDNTNGVGYGAPCRDGIGRGKDLGFGTAQAGEPFFSWDNAGTNSGTDTYADAVANQDFFADGAGCTSGVTSGLDSAKCGTCTEGVGYWATDTRKLYRCGSGNSWSEYYSEYTCPHPLTGLSGTCNPGAIGTLGYDVGSGGGDTTPPANPTGLAVE